MLDPAPEMELVDAVNVFDTLDEEDVDAVPLLAVLAPPTLEAELKVFSLEVEVCDPVPGPVSPEF